jgi:carbamoyl-phosphate synthase large subunit
MGEVNLEPELIPVNIAADKVISEPVTIGSRNYNITCVSLGNPHCVVFFKNVDNIDVSKIGPLFEHNKLFPERVNTEFVKVISPTKLKMRVWERGNGETWACGTGACAAVVAACENDLCDKGSDVKVSLLGGELTVNYTDARVLLTGGASVVYEGSFLY